MNISASFWFNKSYSYIDTSHNLANEDDNNEELDNI